MKVQLNREIELFLQSPLKLKLNMKNSESQIIHQQKASPTDLKTEFQILKTRDKVEEMRSSAKGNTKSKRRIKEKELKLQTQNVQRPYLLYEYLQKGENILTKHGRNIHPI